MAAAPKKNETRMKKLGFGFRDSENKNPNLNRKIKELAKIDGEDESEFLLEDYESDEEGGSKRKGRKCSAWSSSDEDAEEEKRGFFGREAVEERTPKVFFTSRTHSQLSQFVKEFRRTTFALELNLVCLGSRKNMCINPGNWSCNLSVLCVLFMGI